MLIKTEEPRDLWTSSTSVVCISKTEYARSLPALVTRVSAHMLRDTTEQ